MTGRIFTEYKKKANRQTISTVGLQAYIGIVRPQPFLQRKELVARKVLAPKSVGISRPKMETSTGQKLNYLTFKTFIIVTRKG